MQSLCIVSSIRNTNGDEMTKFTIRQTSKTITRKMIPLFSKWGVAPAPTSIDAHSLINRNGKTIPLNCFRSKFRSKFQHEDGWTCYPTLQKYDIYIPWSIAHAFLSADGN
jgi:hypothetical protein